MNKFAAWAEAHRDLWLDCIRIYVGLGLLARGLLLITNTSTGYFVDLLQQAHQPWLLTGSLLHYVMLAHFVGGVLLTIGFLTRLAALVQIPILAGAEFFVHRQDGAVAGVFGAGAFSARRVCGGGFGQALARLRDVWSGAAGGGGGALERSATDVSAGGIGSARSVGGDTGGRFRAPGAKAPG